MNVVTPHMLAQYKAWADELFPQKLSQLSERQLAEPQPIVFGSLIPTLHHVYAMDFVWRAHLLRNCSADAGAGNGTRQQRVRCDMEGASRLDQNDRQGE